MDDNTIIPIDIYPRRIQDIIEHTHETLLFPRNYIAASLFFAAAVAIGNSRTLIFKPTWKVKPVLFMALFGNSGDIKSHPISYALNPLLRIDRESLDKYDKALTSWRKAPSVDRGDKPVAKQIIYQNTTMEALAKGLGSTEHGLAVYVDELKGWLSSFNRYTNGGGDAEQWLSIFNCKPIVVNRKSHDEIIHCYAPFVSVIGGIQPDLMPKLFAGDNMSNGFFYRLLFVNNDCTNQPLLWCKEEDDLPTMDDSDWDKILTRILAAGGYFGPKMIDKEYHLDADARCFISTWHDSIENVNAIMEPQFKTQIFRKIQDYCLRFSIITHTLWEAAEEIPESTIIGIDTAVRATRLADYFNAQAIKAYEIVTKGPTHSQFIRLLDALNDKFTTGEAQAVGAHLGLSRATITRYLDVDDNPDNPFIRKIKHGVYEKIIK